MPNPWFGALLIAALCLPATGQWTRDTFSGKGESMDMPLPHPLSYFTANPFLRDDGEDLCTLCRPTGRARSALTYSIQPMVRRVGSLAGFTVLDVLYSVRRRSDPAPSSVKWKSILVRVAPNRYHEIFHLQAFYTTVSLQPSAIVSSGSEQVLATMDSDGGNGGACWEGYWWFDHAGPHPLDFSPLAAAIQSRMPGNTRFSITCSNLDLRAQLVHSGIQKSDAQCHACDWIGEVTANFRLAGPIVEPRAVTLKPDVP